MRFGNAIGMAFLGAAASGIPFYAAQALAPPAVEVMTLRTFVIVAAPDAPKGRYFDHMAKLTTTALEKKGYRAVAPGQVPEMLVKLSYGGHVLRHRGQDLQFLSTPRATNTSPHEPYPYPAGALFGGERGRWVGGGPATMELYVAVAISGAGGNTPLFEDGVRKRFTAQIVDRVTAELVEAALEGFPTAGI
jgi:hypothetical protein